MCRKFVIAYDFDGTLAAGNMQEHSYIPSVLGMSKQAFWEESTDLSRTNECDPILAYMHLMLQKAAGRVKRQEIQNSAKDIALFPGVETWFTRINQYASKQGIEVEHYIISSGLKEMIEGTVIASQFTKIYASSFLYNAEQIAIWPAMAVNYTTKTQFLFRINKGVLDVTDHQSLNRYIPDDEREVPFTNILFIGDGETDVPCMRLVRSGGGHAISVYDPNNATQRHTSEQLVRDKRVHLALEANYTAGMPLEQAVYAIVDKVAAEARLLALK